MKEHYDLYKIEGDMIGYALFSATGFTSKEIEKAHKNGLYVYKVMPKFQSKAWIVLDETSSLGRDAVILVTRPLDCETIGYEYMSKMMTLKKFVEEIKKGKCKMKKRYEVIRNNGEYGLFSPTGFTPKEMKKADKKGLHHYLVETINEGCMPALLSGISDFSENKKAECAGEMLTAQPLSNETMVYCVYDEMTLKEFIDEFAVIQRDNTLVCAYVKDGVYSDHDIFDEREDECSFMKELEQLIEKWMGKGSETLIYNQELGKKKNLKRCIRCQSKDFDMDHFKQLTSSVQRNFVLSLTTDTVDEASQAASVSQSPSVTFKFQINTDMTADQVEQITTKFHEIFKGNSDYVNNNVLIHSTVFDSDHDNNHIETDVFMDYTHMSEGESLTRMQSVLDEMIGSLTWKWEARENNQ